MDTPQKKPRPRTALTPRMRRFVAEYLKDFNGAQAAVRAGYAPSGARTRAAEMLRNVTVHDAIRAGMQQIFDSCDISVERVVRQLASVAFFDPARAFDFHGRLLPLQEMPLEVRHGLHALEVTESHTTGDIERSTITRKFRMARLPAMIALARYLDLFAGRLPDELAEYDNRHEDEDADRDYEYEDEEELEALGPDSDQDETVDLPAPISINEPTKEISTAVALAKEGNPNAEFKIVYMNGKWGNRPYRYEGYDDED